MLWMNKEDGNVLKVTASDKITRTDIERFAPAFERVAQTRGPLRILIELDGFKGWDARGFWEELKFDVAHRDDMGRVAILGDKAWEEWGTKISQPFFDAEMRYFDRYDHAGAKAWLTRH